MGLLRGLLGKDDDAKVQAKVDKPMLGPGYQRINMWIESRIGKFDPSDPDVNNKLDKLLGEEKVKHPSARGMLILTPNGNDTFITGDTIHFKNILRSLGCKWDAKMKRWVAKDRQLTEDDIDNPSELVGLIKYIDTIKYRTNFGDRGNP